MAIAATLPLGSVGHENAVDEKGERYVWLPPSVVDRLKAMRGPGESYSDVILRLAKGDGERRFNEREAARRCRGIRPS